MRIYMKKFLIIILSAILLVVAGCGSSDQISEKRKNKEIIISVGDYIIKGGFDPTLGWGLWAPDPFHSTLLTHDKTGALVKDLATEMKVSNDGLRYTFKIRSGVKFSDGKALTAESVAFTFNQAKKAGGAVDLSYLKEAIVISPEEVVFVLTKPWSAFPEVVATLGIVPSYAYGDKYGDLPIGSGPWKVVAFQKEQQLVMVPNEYYYGKKPKLNKVTVLKLSDDAALAAVQSGQIDVLFANPEIAKTEVKNMNLVVMNSIDTFAVNLPQEAEHMENGVVVGNNVTSDKAIREALNIGINRKWIIEQGLNGYAEPAYNFSKYISWSNQDLQINDNQVDKAIEILERAGWHDIDGDGIREKNGIKAEFVLNGRSNDLERYHTALALAEDAKKLGIHIIAKATAWSEARKVARHTPTVWAFGDFNPQALYNYFDGSQIGVNVINNPAMYNNPLVNAYLAQGFAATSQEEAYKYFKLAQWDGHNGPKADIPYLWLANVQVPYFVNTQLDVGIPATGERGQGMGILANLDEWDWK